MAVSRVKVTLRDIKTTGDRYEDFNRLKKVFNRRVEDAEIAKLYKRYEFYESPGEKKRRKRRQSASRKFKST